MQKNILTALMKNEAGGDSEVEETVTVMLGDQMRAELELKKRGQAPTDHGISFLAAMAWAALAREGRIKDKLDDFAARCFDVIRAEDAEDVDPTQPAASSDSA